MTNIELHPVSAEALFGEEGPLHIQIPGIDAEIMFARGERGFTAESVINRGSVQERRSIVETSPTEVIAALGEDISVEVLNFANQLPIE